MMAESFGQAEVVPSTEFIAPSTLGRPIMSSCRPVEWGR